MASVGDFLYDDWDVLHDKVSDLSYTRYIPGVGKHQYKKQQTPLPSPLWTPAPDKNVDDVTAEEVLGNDIQQLFDTGQISEDLYTKLMQALLEELDK